MNLNLNYNEKTTFLAIDSRDNVFAILLCADRHHLPQGQVPKYPNELGYEGVYCPNERNGQ